jgi:hypothetical protein
VPVQPGCRHFWPSADPLVEEGAPAPVTRPGDVPLPSVGGMPQTSQ